MRQQLEELGIEEKMEAYEYEEEAVPEEEPYPNYPRNKKCKCGSKVEYRKCCFKDWQVQRERYLATH